jgi:hypothetical protein
MKREHGLGRAWAEQRGLGEVRSGRHSLPAPPLPARVSRRSRPAPLAPLCPASPAPQRWGWQEERCGAGPMLVRGPGR